MNLIHTSNLAIERAAIQSIGPSDEHARFTRVQLAAGKVPADVAKVYAEMVTGETAAASEAREIDGAAIMSVTLASGSVMDVWAERADSGDNFVYGEY